MNHKKFDVEIKRALATNLWWPARGEADSERSLGCNRSYIDLRGMSWADATRVLNQERGLIERLEQAADIEDEHDIILDELYEEDEGLFGLDIGVASTVITLSAAGCIPCSSCNGGAFGGIHHERYPTVAFFGKARQVSLLLECAAEANVGIENGSSGAIVVYAADIHRMPVFASALIRQKADFRVLARLSVTKIGSEQHEPSDEAQLKLPFSDPTGHVEPT